MEQMAEHEGISEKLKSEHPMEWIGRMNALRESAVETEHPMEWIGRMNALRESAVEIVNAEVIFA